VEEHEQERGFVAFGCKPVTLSRPFDKVADDSVRFEVIWGVGAAVIFPLTSFGLLYAIWEFLRITQVSIPWFGYEFIVVAPASIFLIICMIVISILIMELLKSDTPTAKRGALAALAFILLCCYLAAVSFYADKIYPRLAQSLGGGQPIPVVCWLDKHATPDTLATRLARAQFLPEGDKVRCEAIYLLYIDDRIAILADAQTLAAATILPRATITAISAPSPE
jgi:hypothetical protein